MTREELRRDMARWEAEDFANLRPNDVIWAKYDKDETIQIVILDNVPQEHLITIASFQKPTNGHWNWFKASRWKENPKLPGTVNAIYFWGTMSGGRNKYRLMNGSHINNHSEILI